jgi:hypothetical protein
LEEVPVPDVVEEVKGFLALVEIPVPDDVEDTLEFSRTEGIPDPDVVEDSLDFPFPLLSVCCFELDFMSYYLVR